MNKHLLLCGLFASFLGSAVYADSSAPSAEDLLRVAHDLDREQDSSRHNFQTKEMMRKVSEEIKSLALDGADAAEANEAPVDCPQRKRSLLTRIGRGVGRGAVWLSVQTLKPFVKAGSFTTGLLEKQEKNQDILALYNLLLKNSAQFDELYKEAGTPEEFVNLLILSFQQLMEKKSNVILRDTLIAMDLGVVIPQNIADMNWSLVDMDKLDPSKIDPKLINDHPEFQDLKPIIGEFTSRKIADIFLNASFDPEISLGNPKEALPKIHELAGGVVAQIIAPQIILGKISGSLASLYALPVLAADAGLGISIAVCLNKNTQAKFESDKDLRQFCSTATNWSSYQIMKSRASGYVSGKKFKVKLQEWNKKRKLKREERKRAREASRVNRA
jgi:hypothetical protein